MNKKTKSKTVSARITPELFQKIKQRKIKTSLVITEALKKATDGK